MEIEKEIALKAMQSKATQESMQSAFVAACLTRDSHKISEAQLACVEFYKQALDDMASFYAKILATMD